MSYGYKWLSPGDNNVDDWVYELLLDAGIFNVFVLYDVSLKNQVILILDELENCFTLFYCEWMLGWFFVEVCEIIF